MHKTSFDLPAEMQRRANIASAFLGLSASEFYRCAVRAALDTFAQEEPQLRAAFEIITQSEQATATATVSA